MKLWYYAHRLSDEEPNVQRSNLGRAVERFHMLALAYLQIGIRLWAPWFEMAEAGIAEDEAWLVIDKCVRISAGIVLDMDGADEPSTGMIRERDIMLSVGGKVEVVR